MVIAKPPESPSAKQWMADGNECLSLDFGPFEAAHSWRAMPTCDEFVGARRSKHTSVAFNDAIYIFGGDNGREMLNDMLRFDVRDMSWSSCRKFAAGVAPAPRYNHSAVVHGNSMFIFGGYTGDLHSNQNLSNKNDLHEFRFTNGQWTEWKFEGRKPVPRSAHGAAVYENKLWIFAGYDGNARLNDMWCVSLGGNPQSGGSSAHAEKKVWEEVDQKGEMPPTCCNFPVCVARDSMFVFSGQSGAKITNSLYQFKFQERQWTRITTEHILRNSPSPPTRRYGHTMVAHDRHLYVFGGIAEGAQRNDLHSFDLDEWIWKTIEPAASSVVPSGRLYHSASVIGDAMYIFGGTRGNSTRSREMFRFQFSSHLKCTLHEDFGRLFTNRLFCDIDFIVGPDKIVVPAHRAFVAARSTFLREKVLLAAAQQDGEARFAVRLPDVLPEPFLLILNYVYTDMIDPTNAQREPGSNPVVILMMEVFRLAVEFQMKQLQFLTLQYLENAINIRNVLLAMQGASSLNLDDIKEYCLRYIVKECNYNDIVMSQEFETISQSLMVEIIRRRISPSFQCKSLTIDDIRNYCGNLEEDMASLLNGDENEDFTDVTLMLDKHPVKAHKCVLAARCSYFEAMFRSFMPPDNIVNISIGEMVPSKQAFSTLLRYIYYGDVDMPPEDSLYIFSAPSFYGFTNSRLQAACKQNLERNVNTDNVIQVLEAADRIQATDMKKHALNLIVHQYPRVAKLARLRQLSHGLLLDILDALADEMSKPAESHTEAGSAAFGPDTVSQFGYPSQMNSSRSSSSNYFENFKFP